MTTARPSKLDAYAEEIFALQRRGMTLGEITRHLATEHAVRVATSTLSTYLKRPPPPAVPALAEPKPPPFEPPPPPSVSRPAAPQPALTNAQQHFLDQAEVFAEMQASQTLLRDEWAKLSGIVRRIGEDVAADAQRTQRMLDGFSAQLAAQRPAAATPVLAPEALRNAVTEALRATPPPNPADGRIPSWVLLRIWRRAFWYSSLFWIALTVAIASGALRFNFTLLELPGASKALELWLTASVHAGRFLVWVRNFF